MEGTDLYEQYAFWLQVKQDAQRRVDVAGSNMARIMGLLRIHEQTTVTTPDHNAEEKGPE